MNKSNIKLVPPCSYQGGKQRLAKRIVHIPTYVSECNILSDKYEFITKGKLKGNITGVVKTKRKDDLLNIFNK